MPIGISPLVDYSFKKLFGSQPDIAILIHFLNAVLVGQANIVSACIVNPAQGKAFAADKLSILDVLAIDQLGRTFLIEMQISLPAGMAQRLTYCTSVSYAGQLREGDDYVKLRPSISICVLAGAMFSTAQAPPGFPTAGKIAPTDPHRRYPDSHFAVKVSPGNRRNGV
ncbi:MAG UNVERIFIED_CONTAM: Rpn family recombination-promoting nuclease/putative transposase [Planctomycetaceae bacterium]|jgi:predicted transposase/invertase (TIGR01784 family)